MGKTTKYHPIPMSVIRGSAEYCGFKFGRIKQTQVNAEIGRAWYIVDVDVIPNKYRDLAINLLSQALQDCFVPQIEVGWARKSKSGQLRVDLLVDINFRSSVTNGANGGVGGGSGGEIYREDWPGDEQPGHAGDLEDDNDGNCHNEDCYYCSQAILDEDVSRQDTDGHCWHDRCFMDARDEAENRDRSDPSLSDWS